MEKQFPVSWLELSSMYFRGVISDKFIFRDFWQDRTSPPHTPQMCFFMCCVDMHYYYKEQIKTSTLWLTAQNVLQLRDETKILAGEFKVGFQQE